MVLTKDWWATVGAYGQKTEVLSGAIFDFTLKGHMKFDFSGLGSKI